MISQDLITEVLCWVLVGFMTVVVAPINILYLIKFYKSKNSNVMRRRHSNLSIIISIYMLIYGLMHPLWPLFLYYNLDLALTILLVIMQLVFWPMAYFFLFRVYFIWYSTRFAYLLTTNMWHTLISQHPNIVSIHNHKQNRRRNTRTRKDIVIALVDGHPVVAIVVKQEIEIYNLQMTM